MSYLLSGKGHMCKCHCYVQPALSYISGGITRAPFISFFKKLLTIIFLCLSKTNINPNWELKGCLMSYDRRYSSAHIWLLHISVSSVFWVILSWCISRCRSVTVSVVVLREGKGGWGWGKQGRRGCVYVWGGYGVWSRTHSLLPRHEHEWPAALRGREAPYWGVTVTCTGTAWWMREESCRRP